MKKELFALALLLLILVGNVWNQHRLETLTSSLDTLVEEAYASARNGLWQQAAHAAQEAEAQWTDADLYTHIFIRHTDIDALNAAFCDYRGALAGRDEGDIIASYLRLTAGLRSLLAMEKLSAGSVF